MEILYSSFGQWLIVYLFKDNIKLNIKRRILKKLINKMTHVIMTLENKEECLYENEKKI